jgi:hypothetical protein
MMRILVCAALAAAATLHPGWLKGRAIAAPATSISGPFSYGNLAIYFIHGPSLEGPVPLTLQEAMAKGTVHVVETGSVNELKIENAGDEDVYVQSGDIVKGGRQDRVLTASFVLPKESGEIPIAAYCVEHGRWSARGAEDATKFAGSYNSLPSREAKIAMRALARPAPAETGPAAARRNSYASDDVGQRQRAMWDEVAKTQEKLSAGINASVASPVSATSLELTLENRKLQDLRAEYTKALEDKANANDIVGFVFAVNGRLNSADIYPSNGLFHKMWSKLLSASVTEALSQNKDSAEAQAPAIEAVRDFLSASEKSKADAQEIGTLARQQIHDNASVLFIEAATPAGQWVHRNYLAK